MPPNKNIQIKDYHYFLKMSTENRVKNAEFRVQNEGSLCSELYIALQKAESDSLNFAFKSAFCVLTFCTY